MKATIRPLHWLLAATAVLILAGCTGKDERAANYIERAQNAFDQGDLIKAELDAKNALQILPNSFEATYLLAQIHEQDKEPRKMVRFLRRAVEIDPNNVEAQVKMGRIWAAAQQMDEARAAIAAIERADPGNVEAKVLEASVMLNDGDLEGAQALANEVLKQEPRNVSALAFLASTYQVDDVDKSLELLNQALSYDQDNRSLRLVRLAILDREGRVEQAERELRELVGLFPEENTYRYLLAQYLARQERGGEARKVLEDLVKSDPEDLKAKLSLAQFIGQQGDGEGAVALLKGYIQEEPDVYQFRFALAQTHGILQDFDASREVYRNIMQRDGLGPNGLSARTKLAAIELSRGDADLGNNLIAEVLSEEPGNPDALTMRAGLALRDGRYDDATVDLRNVLRADPTRENARLLLGKAHTQNGELALAIETYQKLVAAKPTNVTARKDLSRLYAREQRWEDVRELLEVGVAQRPEDLAMSRLYIDSLLRGEDWDAAEAEAQRILDMDPTKPLGHYVRGRVLQARGQHEAALEPLTVASDLDPSAVETLTAIVRSYIRLDRANDALAFLDSFVASNEKTAHAYSLKGELQARLGNWADAEQSNLEALRVEEAWLPAYRNLLGLYLRDDRLDEAEALVKRGLTKSPGNVELLMLEANVMEQTQRYSEAIDNYAKILDSNPNLAVAANNYVALVADHRQDAESLSRAERFAQPLEGANNPIFQDSVGWLYYRMGRLDDARRLVESAVGQAGQLPQLRYHLGMIYLGLDQLEDARRELEAALAADNASFPGIEDARTALAGL